MKKGVGNRVDFILSRVYDTELGQQRAVDTIDSAVPQIGS